MEIRQIANNEMPCALKLTWETFQKFEAPDYEISGVEEFKRTIDDASWIARHEFLGAFENGKLVGVIATRDNKHIALFFVDGEHHRQGIGKQLFLKVQEKNTDGFLTVNSSPYAKEIYKHLGFVELSGMQEVNGLKFYPMRKDIKN